MEHAPVRAVVALYMSASVVLCATAIAAQAGADLPGGDRLPVHLGGAVGAVHLAVYGYLLMTRRSGVLRVAFMPATGIAMAAVIAAGLFYPDFFRSAFHTFGACYLLFLHHRQHLSPAAIGENAARTLVRFSFAMLLAGLLWVLIHAYVGVFLRLPGTEWWISFNLYTVGMLGIGLLVIMRLPHDRSVTVVITPEAILVNGNDYTGLLGSTDLRLLKFVVDAPGRRATCSDIVAALNEEPGEPQGMPEDCRRCVSAREKASLCPHYRRTYNQILKLKRTIEALGIGTITPPANKMNVTTDGWVLETARNVYLD